MPVSVPAWRDLLEGVAGCGFERGDEDWRGWWNEVVFFEGQLHILKVRLAVAVGVDT
jgi:hypothetical protein